MRTRRERRVAPTTMPEIARTLLAPVLLVQGRRMFKTMPRLRPPDGAPTGTVGDGPPLRLLVVGDSAAAGYGAETLDAALPGQLAGRLAGLGTGRRVTWSMFARFGSTAARTRAFVRKQNAFDVDLAVLSIGINDLIGGASMDAWMADVQALTADLHERFGRPVVVASGLPPIGGFPALPQPMRWVMGRQRDRWDAALHAWADATERVAYVPTGFTDDGPYLEGEVTVGEMMAADGFHPGPKIYAEWARRVVETVGPKL